MEMEGIDISWLGHSGFLLEKSKKIYIDPFRISSNLPKADIILLTHDHYDHCSIEDIEKLVKDGTMIFVPPAGQSKITRFNAQIIMEIVSPGQEYNFEDLKISVVPAYNLDKPFHPKEEDFVGYIIKMDGLIIYHAGDTDKIPEMQKLTGFNQDFVALLPIGGRFTMDSSEAFEAAKLIKPTLAIPMHWGTIVGEKRDALDFKELCNSIGINVEILEKR